MLAMMAPTKLKPGSDISLLMYFRLPFPIIVCSVGIDERRGAKILMAQIMLYFLGILKVIG
tara:strand:- start:42 stop:224 length:183 start_codon:yes stop_codon:yes gene_type:complete